MISMKEKSNVIKYPKNKQMNIGIFIFGIIFVYLIATIIMYITAPRITVYEVRQGSILKDNAYTGLALRDESVIYADSSGYINYYAEDTSKVRIGTKVYTLSDEKLVFNETESEEPIELTKEERSSMIRMIQSYNNQFQTNDYAPTYQFKNELQAQLDKISSQSKADLLDSMISTNQISGLTMKTAAKDGIIVCSIDGMEDLTPESVTIEQLHKINYKKTEFTNNSQVNSGDPVYKIISDNTWNLLIEIDEETKNTLSEKTNVKVNFKKDNQETYGKISFIEGQATPILCLSFDNSMVRYATERYLDIELILEDETGLKIPKSAETTKDFYVVPNTYLTLGGNGSSEGIMRQNKDENGNTITEFFPVTVYYEQDEMIYLDPNVFKAGDVLIKPDSSETYHLQETQALKGVFSINKGYAVFKQIKILCESDNYYIIEEGNSFGLSNYDHIALDSQNIKENDIVF